MDSQSAQRRLPQALIAVCAVTLLVLSGAQCDKLVPAIGTSSTVTLLTDLPSGNPAEVALRNTLEREIMFVRPEQAFEVESLQGARLPHERHARNLVLMADLSRPDPLTAEVEKLVGERLLGEMRAGRRFYALYSDVWATGQSVLVLAAPTTAELATAIDANADQLYESLERRVIKQSGLLVFTMGDQPDYQRYLDRRYGWTMRIPKGYRVSEDAESQVMRFLMIEGGTRLISVHWRDGIDALPKAGALIDLRESIAYQYDEDTVVRERTRSKRTTFLGTRMLQIDGIWENERYTKGGPFRTYCFVDDERLYLIDLLVFDPDGLKIDLMRQAEAVAVTFRDTRE